LNKLIITKTPLRISFFGGGTDMATFYKKHGGAVIGSAIQKYVYVIINERFESDVRASYSKTEIVKNAQQIKNDLIRESLLFFKKYNKLEIVTIADVPGSGTGLGSSSSTLVGLLNAIGEYSNISLTKKKMAENACDIEIKKLSNPIGKQDQYFATYGNLSYLQFKENGNVTVKKIKISKNTKRDLEKNIICFYTGFSRTGSKILQHQSQKSSKNESILLEIKNQAEEGKRILEKGDLSKFGEMLNEGWELKKKLSNKITNSKIDNYYKKAINAGAIGGKINGAGGGGFLTFYCEPKNQLKVRNSLKSLKELDFKIEENGSRRFFSDK
jgi:D-glycero-alpha-D-manno-heptose-7-phosphate kinase